jgi:hypothetical protein
MMQVKTKTVAAVAALGALALLAASAPASAHHSTAMFEWGKEVKVTGVVKEFQWTNPHTWTVFTVSDGKGGTEEWGFEGMSPNYLGRNGWSKGSLKPGDKVDMVYYPLRDGRKGGFTVAVTLPDGKTIRELPSSPGGAPPPRPGPAK